MKRLLFIFLILSIKSFGQKDSEIVFYTLKEALVNPKTVKSLDVSGQHLTQLPNEIAKLIYLEKINIGSNPELDLVQAFDILKQLRNLSILWLTDGQIETIPNNISELKYLEELWLDNNKLISFPEPVKQLRNLKYLRLFSNEIKNLSFKKDELPNLIYIDLCYNKFETFPVELSVLPNLKRILIWYNSISKIPASIKRFNNIEEINLENNKLSSLPKKFGELKSIKKLYLKGNKLTDKSIDPVYKLYGLTDLDLDGNDIRFLSKEIKNLVNLECLSISGNPLADLPVELEQIRTIQQLGIGNLHNFNWAHAFSVMEKLQSLRRVGMFKMNLPEMPQGFDKLQQVDTFWLTFNLFSNTERKRIQEMVPKAKITFD